MPGQVARVPRRPRRAHAKDPAALAALPRQHAVVLEHCTQSFIFFNGTEWGFGLAAGLHAKTQYSLTDNPKVMGAPTGWRLKVTDVSLSAEAGFVVAVAGNMMLMPRFAERAAGVVD